MTTPHERENAITYQFRLAFRHPGRDSEEAAEIIDPIYAEWWRDSVSVLRGREYEHTGCKIAVHFDWAPLSERISRDHVVIQSVRDGTAPHDWYEMVSSVLHLEATCKITGSNRLSKHPWYPGFFIEYFLYEVFLVSNLACPGAANFFSVTIEQESSLQQREPHLSSYFFDEWLVGTICDGAHPAAKRFTATDSSRWFAKIIPGVTQKAETPTQRALYAVYRLCTDESEESTVLWLFNGLESLLSTRVGENFSGLVRRVGLVLKLEPKQLAFATKQLRKLYDIRSSIVHGGLDTAHPMESEIIDPRLNEQHDKFIEPCKFVFSLLAALLQKMIQENRYNFEFEERLVEA
jgi:hypothetical protein